MIISVRDKGIAFVLKTFAEIIETVTLNRYS
jgi:hypothetical protein